MGWACQVQFKITNVKKNQKKRGMSSKIEKRSNCQFEKIFKKFTKMLAICMGYGILIA